MLSCNFQNVKKLPSLTETYRMADKLPFGSYVAYTKVQSIFKDYGINVVKRPFDETWNDIRKSSRTGYSLYFLISKNLVLSDAELSALINYVSAGNDIFISADYIDTKLLESLFCGIDRAGEIQNEVRGKMRDTHVSIFFGEKINAAEYGYYYFPFLNHFKNYEPDFTRILGVNEMKQPNYALFFLGKGRVYLHAAPRIFSNYFLLSHNNYQYFENVISYLRLEPQRIFWDEYYKNNSSFNTNVNRQKDREDEFSSLSVVKQNPALLWAFSIGLSAILLYVIFNIKRKQRVIEKIKPNANATVAFTETVGRLYFQHKDNRHVADNIITYFYEYIRNKYFINSTNSNSEFIDLLSGKSGVSKSETGELFKMIQSIQQQEYISDEELSELNLKIEYFKNQSDGRKFSRRKFV
jgi:hypothetical protein